MTEQARWQRIDRLVVASLELDESERGAFLDAEVADDDVRAEVEQLVAACGDSGHFMESPAVAHIDAYAPLHGSLAPRTIGPYSIREVIGQGGMGEVFLASRADDEYRRQVAIKLLRPGLLGDGLRRFRDERQILATLNHPGIARLYTGGTIADGRPYLVMEYIAGVPIDRYAERHCLSIRQRVTLFREVCAAVHYAHQNLIAHLDIKPDNILVTEDGRPKLLDFGIAKLLERSDARGTDRTRTGLRPLTPQYASPEQLRGDALTTASDMYSLGLVFYSLLTGRLPHRADAMRAGKGSTATGELARPSRAVVAAEALAAPWTMPRPRAQWRRQLAGDLDSIVMMALREEPEQRYGSAERLSSDLRRYLDGLPVRARRGTFGYRARKLVRRYKLAVGVACAALALVIAFAASSAVQAQRLLEERNRAESERANAAEMVAFLVGLFESADPYSGLGGAATAEQLLDEGARRLDHEALSPTIRAKLHCTLGEIYVKLGLYHKARPLLAGAVAQNRELFGGDDLAVAESLDELANLHLLEGDYGDAEPLYLEALAVRERLLPPGDIAIAESQHNLASLYFFQGRLEPSRQLFERALRSVEDRGDRAATAVVMQHLASVLRVTGHYEDAEARYLGALDIYRDLADQTSVALGLNDLARLYLDTGEYARAGPLVDRAVALAEDKLGPRHPHLVTLLRNQAECHHAMGDVRRAERSLRRALELSTEAFGPAHLETRRVASELTTVTAEGDRVVVQ